MFTDELIGLDMAHRREMRNMGRNAQAVVDDMGRDIQRLRRQLAAAHSSNRDLLIERGQRNNARLMERMFKH